MSEYKATQDTQFSQYGWHSQNYWDIEAPEKAFYRCWDEDAANDLVRILNAHDDLVAALKGVLAIFPEPLCKNLHHEKSEYHKVGPCPAVARHNAIVESARAALAKAGVK